MLRGDLSYLSKYTWNTGSSPYTINGLTALSYEQMSGRADIDGKSFTALLNGGSDASTGSPRRKPASRPTANTASPAARQPSADRTTPSPPY